MADSRAVESGHEAGGSQTQDAGNAGLARGAAGSETGARPGSGENAHNDIEERHESEQVLRPTSDGMGDGLTKDQS
jgi:hypothetical protein